jgi:hypothetical protein
MAGSANGAIRVSGWVASRTLATTRRADEPRSGSAFKLLRRPLDQDFMPSAVRDIDNPALSSFELDANGVTAVANYTLDGNVMTLTHTETPQAARCKWCAGEA